MGRYGMIKVFPSKLPTIIMSRGDGKKEKKETKKKRGKEDSPQRR